MRDAFIKLHLSILLAGFTGIFGKLISLSEGVLVWYRLLIASMMLLVFLQANCVRQQLQQFARLISILMVALP